MSIPRIRCMVYEQIEYQVRASLGRNEWALLIYYPDNADGKATVYHFSGTKEEGVAVARRKIEIWLNGQKRKALHPKGLGLKGRPRGSRSRT